MIQNGKTFPPASVYVIMGEEQADPIAKKANLLPIIRLKRM